MPQVVNVHNFLLSVRETGYRSFAHSIAELVDNSVQAGATCVSIDISAESGGRIVVTDNGAGMSEGALRTALQFGGSTRFGDRAGAGRFGMGLPTSSVSLAKRVDVYTRNTDTVLHTYLDVDELRRLHVARLPKPSKVADCPFTTSGQHWTTVVLTQCDRAGVLNEALRLRQTKFELSRIFRFPLWHYLRLEVNGEKLEAFDPLFLRPSHNGIVASLYGPVLNYHLPLGEKSGLVEVRFSELPVAAWRGLPNGEKQSLGISRGAGVSIVRCEREIAYGWYFFGSKRRENYDDWWRCEVKFSPELDEYFGVNHTKQQINPSIELDRLLTPDLEGIARALNARIRQNFVVSATPKRTEPAKAAGARDKYLPSLLSAEKIPIRHLNYRIEIDSSMVDNNFYRAELKDLEILVYLNARHPITARYIAAKKAASHDLQLFEYAVLAAARAELAASTTKARWWFRSFRAGWSDTLAAFLGN